MTGGKTLTQVRAELEAALGSGPTGGSEVAEALRRFLAAGSGKTAAPDRTMPPSGAATQVPAAGPGRRGAKPRR
jgi:hypothetical protein